MIDNPPSTHRESSLLWIIRLAGAWLLVGSIAKTFVGTPAELPQPILASDLDPLLVIVVAIVIESFAGIVALIAPRVGWMLVMPILVGFLTLLTLHVRSGAGTCGCFGGSLAIPAWLVLTVDGALLAGTLFTVARAGLWRRATLASALPTAVVSAVLGMVTAMASGWYGDHRLAAFRGAESRAAMVTPSPSIELTTPIEVPLVSAPTPPSWRLPDSLPETVLLRPIQWINKPLAATELGRWTDTSAFPRDATLILYYLSCNHCADHLRDLAERQAAQPASSPTYVLVQLPTPVAYTGTLFVDRLPTHAAQVVLPQLSKGWVITPPWDVTIKNGVVVKAERVLWSGEKKP